MITQHFLKKYKIKRVLVLHTKLIPLTCVQTNMCTKKYNQQILFVLLLLSVKQVLISFLYGSLTHNIILLRNISNNCIQFILSIIKPFNKIYFNKLDYLLIKPNHQVFVSDICNSIVVHVLWRFQSRSCSWLRYNVFIESRVVSIRVTSVPQGVYVNNCVIPNEWLLLKRA